ncbi:hypothetical protein CHL79_03420 [Delftia acidovorans]|jgi:type IV pilus assembly protein PilX|uniref:pilus assembly PilX family protein n=1 Tax=Delftia acidovorans TaxID=80866 RepID=UPI000BC357E0|nr:PilX N-terminal domain-containing pilus assembly protein [Delftia acidovorans]ATH11541.1 hypothetical protein CHL79_03420 [Delftia acidovorans]
MNGAPHSQHSPSGLLRRPRQRGISLYVIIVLVLLSMLLALWASRTTLLNEMIVGNDADYRRAFEAAQAMLQDAEMDIRGVNTDGSFCVPDSSKGDICRRTTSAYFDIETKDLPKLINFLDTQDSKCYKGICQKFKDPQDFWHDPDRLAQMTAADVGARYGQFTGAKTGDAGNPILNITATPSDMKQRRGAWYWVEVLPYVDPNISLLGGVPPGSNVETFSPSRKKRWVYRITALARGLKPGTEVVLQSALSLSLAE